MTFLWSQFLQRLPYNRNMIMPFSQSPAKSFVTKFSNFYKVVRNTFHIQRIWCNSRRRKMAQWQMIKHVYYSHMARCWRRLWRLWPNDWNYKVKSFEIKSYDSHWCKHLSVSVKLSFIIQGHPAWRACVQCGNWPAWDHWWDQRSPHALRWSGPADDYQN